MSIEDAKREILAIDSEPANDLSQEDNHYLRVMTALENELSEAEKTQLINEKFLSERNTLLLFALREEYLDLALYLLQNKADITIRNEYGIDALNMLAMHKKITELSKDSKTIQEKSEKINQILQVMRNNNPDDFTANINRPRITDDGVEHSMNPITKVIGYCGNNFELLTALILEWSQFGAILNEKGVLKLLNPRNNGEILAKHLQNLHNLYNNGIISLNPQSIVKDNNILMDFLKFVFVKTDINFRSTNERIIPKKDIEKFVDNIKSMIDGLSNIDALDDLTNIELDNLKIGEVYFNGNFNAITFLQKVISEVLPKMNKVEGDGIEYLKRELEGIVSKINKKRPLNSAHHEPAAKRARSSNDGSSSSNALLFSDELFARELQKQLDAAEQQQIANDEELARREQMRF